MSKYTLPNMTAGFDNGMVDIATQVPSFVPMLLFFIFGAVFISGFTGQKRRTGTGDAPMWFTLASLSVFLVSLILSLKSGLISIPVISIVIGITILSFILLALSKGRYE